MNREVEGWEADLEAWELGLRDREGGDLGASAQRRGERI